MYKHTILGKELTVSNEAYGALVRKWRVKGIREVFGGWAIKGKCTYCGKYFNDRHCKKCPFDIFSIRDDTSVIPERIGCTVLMESICNDFFRLNFSSVEWRTKEQAIAAVSAVKKVLSKFKKVK